MEQNNVQMNQTVEQVMNISSNTKLFELFAKAQENKAKVTAYVGKAIDTPKVSEGKFISIITNAKHEPAAQTQFGLRECLKVYYTVLLPNGMEPEELCMYYWKTSNPNSLYVKHLSTLLEVNEINGFNVADLIGKQCQITVAHNLSKNNRTYANVVDLSLLNIPIGSTNTINF